MKFFAFLCLALTLSTSAFAADSGAFTATYGLYTGGMKMIEVKAAFDLQDKAYKAATDARTIGLFSKLLPWWGAFETTGENPGFQPLKHDYTVSWMGKVEKSTFNYEPAGTFKNMTLTRKGETQENPVDPAIAQGTRDLLSSALTAFSHYQQTGKCEADVLTFDNARSFIVRYADAGDAVMDNPKLSSYTGPAHGCTVEIIPQKGKWPKKPRGWLRIQQQSKAGGRLPILWLARPKPDLPAIPVRVDIHTKYGDVIAHLTGVQ